MVHAFPAVEQGHGSRSRAITPPQRSLTVERADEENEVVCPLEQKRIEGNRAWSEIRHQGGPPWTAVRSPELVAMDRLAGPEVGRSTRYGETAGAHGSNDRGLVDVSDEMDRPGLLECCNGHR